ncbi:hypothetical protein [Streptomyces jumonjinensis]
MSDHADCREAIGYLRSGDGWTAERILRAAHAVSPRFLPSPWWDAEPN